MSTVFRGYIENGLVKTGPVPAPESVQIQLYEVLRVIDRVPLFVEDHFARFGHSCTISGLRCPVNFGDFLAQLKRLIAFNSIENGNLKIDLNCFPDQSQVFYVYQIPHSYPAAVDYRAGVRCGLLKAERVNPQAKVLQQAVRERANKAIADNNWYEVMLVNDSDCITEGSRSNVFFIKNEGIYTAPAAQVLLGITRAKVMDCISALGLVCSEVPISIESLSDFDAAFISGTSPKILPIAQIEGLSFDVNNTVLRRLTGAYDQLISSYILERKPAAGEV